MPFEGPIHLDLTAEAAALRAEARSRDVRCICERSPWCRGALSADWTTCSTSCRACQPSPWQAPTRPAAAAGEPNT